MSVESEVRTILRQGQARAQAAQAGGRAARSDAERAGAAAEMAGEMTRANSDAILVLAQAIDKLRGTQRVGYAVHRKRDPGLTRWAS